MDKLAVLKQPMEAIIKRGLTVSEVYKVDVFLDQDGEIVDTYCDCPYDLGVYCKHQGYSFTQINR
jgi:hypothetical protein